MHSTQKLLPQLNRATVESRSTNLQGKRKLDRKIGEIEKLGVKLQYSTEEGKRLLVQIIGRFIKLRVPEIGIPLYVK